jgi:hypothetical protein
MTCLLIAAWAATIVAGTWLLLRIEPTDPPKPSARAAHDLRAADTGARAGESPLPGAGPTLKHPAPAASPGRSARHAPGSSQ